LILIGVDIEMPADARYAFLVDWLDPQAQLVRQYLLFYYSVDNSVEMDDLKNRRKFLRRCEYPGIRFENLYLGATVNVYSRELTVSDYGDEFTKTALQTKKEKTLALIKPDAYLKCGRIIDAIQSDGFRIAQLRTIQLTRRDAEEFYAEHR
jgi:nucleoside-diphosphate kinase